MSIIHPEPCSPCGGGSGGRDVENLLLCDVVDGETVGTALAVYEYDAVTGLPVGAPTFVDPVTGAPYIPTGVLQPCSSGGGGASGEVVVTNAIALDEDTLAALETVTALVSGTVGLDALTLAALENIVVSGEVALDAATLAALETINAVVSGTVELGATTLAALENITVTVSNEVEIKNDSGNPVPVTGTVELGSTSLAALEDITVEVADTVNVLMAQMLDTNNSAVLTSAEASPGSPWEGDWTQTRSLGFVRQQVVLAATDPDVGGIFTFQYSEDGSTPTVSEVREIGDFDTVRDFGLLNFGEWFRVKFEPAAPLGAESVFVTTQQHRQDDGPFVRLANQETEETNMAAGNVFAYGKAFDPTGKSVNLRAGGHDPANSFSNNPFAAAGVFIGDYRPTAGLNSLLAFIITDAPLATARIEWSPDGVNPSPGLLSTSDMLGTVQTFDIPGFGTLYVYLVTLTTLLDRYYRLHVVNGATPTTLYSEGDVFVYSEAFGGSYGSLSQSLSNLSTALLTRAVGAGYNPDEEFVNLRAQGVDSGNSTTTPLDAMETFRGIWFPWQANYIKSIIDLAADVSGTLYIDFSEVETPTDGVDTDVNDSVTLGYDPTITALLKRQTPVQSKWYRVRYTNGEAAQAMFSLDAALVTSDPGLATQSLSLIPRLLSQAGMVRAVTAIINADGTGYQEVPVDDDGIPYVHATLLDGDVKLAGLSNSQVRQFVVGTTPIQLDVTKLAGRRQAAIGNLDETATPKTLWIGHDPDITADSATFAIYGKTEKGGAYDENTDLWAVLRDTGATETVLTRTGASASGTGTSPSNALASDGSYCSLASGQDVDVAGFTAGTANTLVSVKVCAELAKLSGQFETVGWLDVTTGAAGNVGSVATSSSVPAGTKMTYLAWISRESAATVTSVTGLGLTWTQVLSKPSNDANRTLDLWVATGTPAAAGVVTATFSTTATSSHIAVGRYYGVDQGSPIQATASGALTSTAVSLTTTIAVTNKGMAVIGVAEDNTTATAAAGYTERLDIQSVSGTIDGLAIATKPITGTGTEAPTMTLAASKHYAAIGVSLLPAAAYDPVATISYKLSSVTGVTTQAVTVTNTVDAVTKMDVTTDRAWVYTDIASVEGIVTGTTVTGAPVLVDQVYLELTDSTATTIRVSLREIA